MAQIPHLSSENIFFIRRQRKGREKALSKIKLGTFEEEERRRRRRRRSSTYKNEIKRL
jgi:hypothetical protein